MPASKSAAQDLLKEARAIELLADETEASPENLPAYWEVAADLITLMADIEEFAALRPRAPADDLDLLDLRHRLRGVAARLGAIALDAPSA